MGSSSDRGARVGECVCVCVRMRARVCDTGQAPIFDPTTPAITSVSSLVSHQRRRVRNAVTSGRGRCRHAELPSLGVRRRGSFRRTGVERVRAVTGTTTEIPRRQSRFRRRDALRTLLVVSRSLVTHSHHTPTYAHVHVRRRAARLRRDRTRPGPKERGSGESFFSLASTRPAESMCGVTLPNCLF